MAPLRVLICGGGIAGPALAYWLARLRYDVTVVERFLDLRASGQQIDLRGQGLQAMRRMGLDEEVRSRTVHEPGIQFVDASGQQRAVIRANLSGKGRQSVTAEYEIMRGDLCSILYAATKDSVRYVFGTQVEDFREDEHGGVRVRLSDGSEEAYDLLVGADGQGSRTRRMMLVPDAPDPFHFLGMYLAYFTIPRTPQDSDLWTVYHMKNHRAMATRTDNPETLQAYMNLYEDNAEVRSVLGSRDIAEQKRIWASLFEHDRGWIVPRILDALHHDPLAEDFYFQQVGQVKMPTWSKGPVVLLGDAACCPAPVTGLGTTTAFVGAYVLAGELGKRFGKAETETEGGAEPPAAKDSKLMMREALEAYDRVLRPFIDKVQYLPPGIPSVFYPGSSFGIKLLHSVFSLVTILRLDKLGSRLQSDNIPGWKLPEYPKLGYP